MEDPESQLTEFLSTYSEGIRCLAQALREYLKKVTEPAYELAGKSAQSFNIGYGFTTTSWDCFCAIIVYANHINISFPSGASLRDAEGLLHGTGARVRHLKVKELKDVQTEAVLTLLSEARKNALFLLRDAEVGHDGITTVIKTKGPRT